MSKKMLLFIYIILALLIFNTNEVEIIETNKSQLIFIKEDIDYSFSSEDIQNDLMVSLHSINCKISINFNNSEKYNITINKKNDDLFSFRLNKDSIKDTTMTLIPLIYSTNEREEENTKNKTCPVIITNFYIPEEKSQETPKLNIKDISYIYFDTDLTNIELNYNNNNLDSDEPFALSLSFNQKTALEIIITNEEESELLIHKNISNSTNILFDKNNFNSSENLKIIIMHADVETPVFVSVKLIKNNSISILEQNNLNLGFISSELKYQFYYMEVFKEQEGEIMLHNKRKKGKISAYLIEKEKISDLNDINLYPIISSISPDSLLEYNPHTAKLYFNYKNTSKCENGCYLFITYYKDINQTNALMGYEYTILARIWDYYEYSPQIINIPFNEYILGSFDDGSITHHYYSIFIPKDTEKIIIQIESNYLDAFIGEGIVKLNTIKKLEEIKNLDIYRNQEVFVLTKENMNFDFKGKYISLALRSKNYFEEIFSFYYFRILYLKKDEPLYYPLDSNIGNLCLPEEEESEKYICNLILDGSYNEFSSNFSLSGSNEIEYFVIKYAPLYKNNTLGEFQKIEFRYLYQVDSKAWANIDKFFLRYEFSKKGIKNIISAFNEQESYDSIQIYSSRMFHLFRHRIHLDFSLKHNYTLTYKHVGGWIGGVKLDYVGFQNIFSTRNFRGKPIAIEITGEKEMEFWCLTYDYSFYIKLSYNMRNEGVEEITSEETRSEILVGGYFPLYYYLNVTNKKNVDIDINIRLNSYDSNILQNDFQIKGYIINEDLIKRKIRGENIVLRDEDAISGTYMVSFNFGYLKINKERINDNDYILITIMNNDQTKITSYFLVEIVTQEYQERYFMPINQYLIESFTIEDYYQRNENKYYFDINNIYHSVDKRNSTILVEFSPNYDDLELNFETQGIVKKEFFVTGFQKYRIINSTDNIIYFNIKNPNNRTNTNYFLRYYYSDEDGENTYIFKPERIYKERASDSEKVSISLTFDSLEILREGKPLPLNEEYNITFYIFAYLYPKNDTFNEKINASALLHQKPLYQSKAQYIYYYENKYTLNFDNILRTDNYIYDLQVKIRSFIGSNIFNEELLTFATVLDLKNIANKKEEESNTLVFILLGVIAAILLVLIILFFVYRKLRRDNSQLREEYLSMTYSAGIEKNVLKEQQKKKDDDYDTTFI